MMVTEPATAPPRAHRPTLVFGPFTFDPDNQLLRRGPEEIAAPPRVFGVLGLLLERAGELVARPELIDRVWKDAFVTDTSLAEAVSALRQVLGDDAQSPTYIQTVHRRGYRFIAPVEARPRPAAVPVSSGDDQHEVVSPSIGGHLVPWSMAVLCGLVAAVAIFQLTTRREPAPVAARFSFQLEAGQRFDRRGAAIALSPDGSSAAWVACADGCRLYVRPLGRLQPEPLAGTDNASAPFYSPDGAWLGFFADGALKKVRLSGGAPAVVSDVSQPLGAAWTNQGRIIFASGLTGGLWQVSEEGGTPERLTVPRQGDGEVRHAWPSVAPDGQTIVFTIATTLEVDAPARLAVATLRGRSALPSWTILLGGVSTGQFIANDLLVFARGTELQAVRFDPLRRMLVGVPQALGSAVATGDDGAQFAVSRSGTLLYTIPYGTPTGPRLAWTRDGISVEPLPDLDLAGVPALSPDARRLAWAGPGDGARADVRVGDLERGAVTRLTHDGLHSSPLWAADSRRLYFARRDSGLFRIGSAEGDGSRPSLLPALPGHAFPASFSADGRTLALVVAAQETMRDIWTVGMVGDTTPRQVVHSKFDDAEPALSRDGSLLAYQSDEGGRWDIYVLRITDGRRAIVSTTGGERPFWSTDGASIIYRAGTSLVRASVRHETLTVGAPSVVITSRAGLPLRVGPDGRVLINRRATASASSAVLALHWEREARRLLGPAAAVLPR